MAVPRLMTPPLRPASVRATGPVSSSGTNNTISATRMIAPVSRSFTLSTDDGGEMREIQHADARFERRPQAAPLSLLV